MIEIDDTLEAMQKVVGGDIEKYMPFDDDVAIICNEEGKVNGLPPNRAVYAEPEAVEMSYREMTKRFREAENSRREHLTGYVVFTEDSFDKPYSEKSRTYVISSDNKTAQTTATEVMTATDSNGGVLSTDNGRLNQIMKKSPGEAFHLHVGILRDIFI